MHSHIFQKWWLYVNLHKFLATTNFLPEHHKAVEKPHTSNFGKNITFPNVLYIYLCNVKNGKYSVYGAALSFCAPYCMRFLYFGPLICICILLIICEYYYVLSALLGNIVYEQAYCSKLCSEYTVIDCPGSIALDLQSLQGLFLGYYFLSPNCEPQLNS